jgi:hypothetical protein
VYGAISSYEHDSLLKEIQVVNKDYSNSAVLETARSSASWGGLHHHRAPDHHVGQPPDPDVAEVRRVSRCLEGHVADIGPRADKSYATQVYLCMTLGATRTQAGKQIQVLCDDQI